MDRDIYCGCVKLKGDEDERTIRAASNYAASLITLQRLEEAKSLLRKTIPVARRIVGESAMITLTMRKLYALWDPDTVTLGDLREAINTLEEMEPIARRVFGDAHPLTESIVWQLGQTRAAFRTREMLRRSG